MNYLLFVMFILIRVFSCYTTSFNESDALTFLMTYDYIKKNTSESIIMNPADNEDFQDAVLAFQNYYNILPNDGHLNNATISLMSQPRCGVSDLMNAFKASQYKWQNKTTLTWKFISGGHKESSLTNVAFETWSNHTNLRFIEEQLKQNTDIVISYEKYTHNKRRCCNHGQCDDFDGPGHTLAHADYPYNKIVEIHIDGSEKWDYSLNGNFCLVLIHEIGHVLGLEHSGVVDSIMWPYYNPHTVKLSSDDIAGIQYLYGKPSTNNNNDTDSEVSTTPSTTSTTKPTTTIKTTEETTIQTTTAKDEHSFGQISQDICQVQKQLNTFLFFNQKFYIFFKNWVWLMDHKSNLLLEPDKINNWLKFLPLSSSYEITNIYQRFNNEAVLIIDSNVYVITIPSLVLKEGPVSINNFYKNLPKINKINALFNSYQGNAFIIYNDIFVGEINVYNNNITMVGMINDIFPGIPSAIEGAYRYIDGNLYFIQADNVYIYNEFLKSIITSKPRGTHVFNVDCPSKPILKQLQDLLNQILYRQIHV